MLALHGSTTRHWVQLRSAAERVAAGRARVACTLGSSTLELVAAACLPALCAGPWCSGPRQLAAAFEGRRARLAALEMLLLQAGPADGLLTCGLVLTGMGGLREPRKLGAAAGGR